MPKRKLMIIRCLMLMLIALAIGLVAPVSLQAAPPSFGQAVGEYKRGNYRKALGQLEAYKKAYPSNAMVRYYIALCHQSLGQIGAAQHEYEWVSRNGDAKLQALSQEGISRMNTAQSRSYSSASTYDWTPKQTANVPNAATLPVAPMKVRKVVCVYTENEEWRAFSPSWNSLRSRYSDLQFEQFPGGSFGNYEQQYGLTKAELPAVILVYVNDKDRNKPNNQQLIHPIWSMKPPLNEATIAAAIDRYR